MTRLLAVSAGFVLLAETLVFLPSMADERNRWLVERADSAEIAVLAARIGQENGFRRESADDLMRAAQIVAIHVTEGGTTKLVAGTEVPGRDRLERTIIGQETLGASLMQPLRAMLSDRDGLYVIQTRPRANAALRMEVTVRTAPLRNSLLEAAWRLALTTLALSALIGALVYASLVDGFVRPLRRLTEAITRFRDSPEDARNQLVTSGRNDEIGEAEEALADMQDALRQSLLQRQRLAQLGTAVSKIAHDLRHSLASAQLVTERLADVDDPVVRATAPRLERAITRAAGLAEASLRFGKAEEPPPDIQAILLEPVVAEAAEEALAGLPQVRWSCDIPEGARVAVDPDQFHRLLANLIRNAGQAVARSRADGSGTVSLKARRSRLGWRIDLADNGPGIPDRVRSNLFTPFNANGVSGGTGLGLVISQELARMNGGDVRLVSTGPTGTVFEVTLNDPA
jgi:signal transduction histidine kinase